MSPYHEGGPGRGHNERREERNRVVFSRRDLERLLDIAENPVLSVYLHTDPAQDPKASYRIWLKDALKELEGDIPSHEAKRFREAAERAHAHVKENRPQGKSWVAFVGGERFEAFNLRVPVENEAQWGRPELTQLKWLLEEYRPYGVVLADSETLRFFIVAMNEIRELDERELELDTSEWRRKDLMPPAQTHGSPVRGAVRGGSRRDEFAERMEIQTERFWKEASGVLKRLAEVHGAEELVLSGPKDVRERFLQTLGSETERIIGQISVRTGAPPSEVLEESLEVIQAHEREMERHVVEELLRRASTSAQASVGLEATLRALQEGRVSKVVVNRRLNVPLKECANCSYVLPKEKEQCPHCGSKELKSATLRGLLPVLARRFGAELEVILRPAAEELAPHGGIGALWRY